MIATRKRPGEQVTWADYNALLDMLESLLVVPGNGIQVSRSPRGQMVSTRLKPASSSAAAPMDETDGPVTELGHTHGTRDTDTWTVGGTNNARVYVVTDIWYDPTTFKEMYRMRPMEITASGRVKQIGAEDDPGSIVFEAAECQAQPDEVPT